MKTPHSRTAEFAVLGAVLLRNDLIGEIDLAPEDFYVPAHQSIWEAMRSIRGRGDSIEVITLEKELRVKERLGLVGGLKGLLDLQDSGYNHPNFKESSRVVAELARQRRLREVALQIADSASGEVESIDELAQQAEQGILEASRIRGHGRYQKASTLVHPVFSEISEDLQRKERVIGHRTGIVKLDNMTRGFESGKVYVLAARPGMGKTALALNISGEVAIRSGAPVLFVSVEMSKEELIKRSIYSEAEVDSSRMNIASRDLEKLVRASGLIHDAPLWIDESGSPSMSEVRAVARRWKYDPEVQRTQKMGLMIVDYLQLLRGSDRAGNREQEVAEVSRGMKALAKELEIPVLLLAQLNRGLESRNDKRPMLSDLRESGAIEQDADTVMFIYRPVVYAKTDEEIAQADGLAEIIVSKQRSGKTGTVRCSFRSSFTRFGNLEENR